jgi:hypothetical protein
VELMELFVVVVCGLLLAAVLQKLADAMGEP